MPEAITDTASTRTLWSCAQHWAQTKPNNTAIAYAPDNESLEEASWEELAETVEDVRGRLSAYGIEGGHAAVVLALPNGPLTIAIWLAVMANGAIVQAMDEQSGSLQLERAMTSTSPRMVIAHSSNIAVVSKAADTVGARPAVIRLNSLSLNQRLSDVDGWSRTAAPQMEANSDSVAALLPTSGTSGAPKLVELTGHNYVMGAERMARNSGFMDSDRHYLCSPFFHTNAQVYIAAPPLITGGSMAIVPRFSANGYFSEATRLGATVSSMVAPPMRMALHAALKSGAVPRTSLRLIQYGMNMSDADWDEWDKHFSDIETRQIYGQTETISGVLGGSPWETDDRRSIGRAFVGTEGLRLVRSDGSDVTADGEPGELLVKGSRGRSLMRGYHNNPAATSETLSAGWLHTGDIMTRTPNGRFVFQGRHMHIIRRGGENLSTYALELDIQRCPLVSDVAIASQKDERLDSLVVAHVIPTHDFEEKAFLSWCREMLGKRSTPDVVRVHTSFPRTPSGRVIVRELA